MQVYVESLDLAGALRVEAKAGQSVRVCAGYIGNAGYETVPVSSDASEVQTMRGYTFVKKEEELVEGKDGGEVLIYEGPVDGSAPPCCRF